MKKQMKLRRGFLPGASYVELEMWGGNGLNLNALQLGVTNLWMNVREHSSFASKKVLF